MLSRSLGRLLLVCEECAATSAAAATATTTTTAHRAKSVCPLASPFLCAPQMLGVYFACAFNNISVHQCD